MKCEDFIVWSLNLTKKIIDQVRSIIIILSIDLLKKPYAGEEFISIIN